MRKEFYESQAKALAKEQRIRFESATKEFERVAKENEPLEEAQGWQQSV